MTDTAISFKELFEIKSSPNEDFGFILLIKCKIRDSDISVNLNSSSLGAPRKSVKFLFDLGILAAKLGPTWEKY